ncbi:MAG TPA: nuclear transport factor 2 family protein [Acidimicrobiales bacterium]|nr:nuclear transport factor 2 family protein [Acidimicrobiales bacterium]
MDRRRVERWTQGYEKAWRTAGTEMLAELFTPDVVYSPSPWSEPVVGLEALEQYWEAERQGPDEDFSMEAEVLAVEMETAVVRVAVDYHVPPRPWRDLWVVLFSPSGRCWRFEEWPFAPDQTDGHR